MNAEHWDILSIEDDKDVQDLYKDIFQKEGCSLYQVYDGAVALQFLESGSTFSVAIIDIMLPNASGYEVLNRIRLKENHPPIIVLSAIATEDDPIIELRPGKVVYIMKGAVPLNTIATKIREYISSLASS